MRNPVASAHGRRRGFTMLELLIAAVLTLILTSLVVQIFAFVSDGVFNSRANIEMNDQLRNAKNRLAADLRGIIAPTIPPLAPEMDLGYFEYVEGPSVANDPDGDAGVGSGVNADTTIGDRDDILMFTTCSFDEPFIGKNQRPELVGRTPVAEVAWFLHSGKLYRRTFLVNTTATGWGQTYAQTDLSMRQRLGIFESTAMAPPPGSDGSLTQLTQLSRTVLNSLGDLTMRENRSLHQPYVWPYEMIYNNGTNVTGIMVPVVTATALPSSLTNITSSADPYTTTSQLGLPTLMTQGKAVNSPTILPISEVTVGGTSGPLFPRQFRQTWSGGYHPFLTPELNEDGTLREADDLILSHVVSFDVKAWDPGAPLFRATPVAGDPVMTDANQSLGLICPGDAGYRSSLSNFISGNITSINAVGAPVAFGAYADLNYMWDQHYSPDGNENRHTLYLNVLADQSIGWESKLAVNGIRPRLPRPSFGFGTRGRPLSGFPPQVLSQADLSPFGGPAGGTGTQYVALAVPAVYDTWSRHYEFDGINNDDDSGPGGNHDEVIDTLADIRRKVQGGAAHTADWIDEGTDGIDNNGNGYIDEPPVPIDSNGDGVIDAAEMLVAERNGERDAPPPFDAPLRGIKITIRVMEQDSKQVREVSVVHEFLPL
jgi:prepilin-type N-terminal cleavage/methylation domain-containing protein